MRLQWRPDALEIAVLDDGRGAAAAVADPDGTVPVGAGTGCSACGSAPSCTAAGSPPAPRHGGGFGVHALLPYRAPR